MQLRVQLNGFMKHWVREFFGRNFFEVPIILTFFLRNQRDTMWNLGLRQPTKPTN